MAKYGARAADIIALLHGLGYTMHAWHDGAWRPADRVTADERNYLFAA